MKLIGALMVMFPFFVVVIAFFLLMWRHAGKWSVILPLGTFLWLGIGTYLFTSTP